MPEEWQRMTANENRTRPSSDITVLIILENIEILSRCSAWSPESGHEGREFKNKHILASIL